MSEPETFAAARERALRHVARAERAALAPRWLKDAPAPPLREIAVLGDTGVACALLAAGFRVVLLEEDADGVERASWAAGRLIRADLQRGAVSAEEAAQRRAALIVTEDCAQAAGAGLAILTAAASGKRALAALQDALPGEAILAADAAASGLDALAAMLADPARLVGLHFSFPAETAKLLELARGAATSDRALALGFALARALGKVPVLARGDDFASARIQARYREAADTVFMDGSTPWEVDEAMVEFGCAMGPYEAQDISGLDVEYADRRRRAAGRDPNRRQIPILGRMLELGKLGRKVGAGWYRYPGGGGKVDDPIVADLAIEESYFAGRERTDYRPEDIRERLLLAAIGEAADILHEGAAACARDIDLVTVCGLGFPRWRGGLMRYADTLGAKTVAAKIEALAEEDPIAWRLSPLLRHCAETGARLADWRADKD